MGQGPWAQWARAHGAMGMGPMGQGPWANGQGPMGQGPWAQWARAHGPMGQGPRAQWARAHHFQLLASPFLLGKNWPAATL